MRVLLTQVQQDGSDDDFLDGEACFFFLASDLGGALLGWCCGFVRDACSVGYAYLRPPNMFAVVVMEGSDVSCMVPE